MAPAAGPRGSAARQFQRNLAREDDVFFRPVVRALAMRASCFVGLELGLAPRFFFHRLPGGSQFRSCRASDEDSFDHGVWGLFRGKEMGLTEAVDDAGFVDVVG